MNRKFHVENWFWIGSIVTAVVFLIFKFGYNHSRIIINTPDQDHTIPYFHAAAVMIAIQLLLWLIYRLWRKNISPKLPAWLILLQFGALLFASLLFISRNHDIAQQMMSNVHISPDIRFPYDNLFEIIWGSSTGQIVLITGMAGLALLPVNLIISMIRK